jgi:protein-tyrosine phosphatase
MIDYHCHLLPGIDDGASTIEDSIRMSQLLSEAGYRSVYCTPHLINDHYDASNETVRQAIKNLQNILYSENIQIKLLEGREYYLDEHFLKYQNDLMPLEGTHFILIEIPSNSYPEMVKDIISAIIRRNFIPMIAHPERCGLFFEKHEIIPKQSKGIFRRTLLQTELSQANQQGQLLLEWLVNMRCAFQCNLASFIGAYGIQAQTSALHLLSRNIFTHQATDAHSPGELEKLFLIKNILCKLLSGHNYF